MELIYRGHRYQKNPSVIQDYGIEYPCTYRQVPYQLKLKRPSCAGLPRSVVLTYRGVSYNPPV